MNQRAWATLEIKSMSDAGGKRKFTGVASTPSVDRGDDVVDPEGCSATLPLPFLWMHNAKDPVGWVTAMRISKKGIEVDVEIADIDEPGQLKDRLTLCWQMLRTKLVRGLSIGFLPIESSRIEGTYGTHYLKWEMYELSAVVIPMNAQCGITSIKALDLRQTAARDRKIVRLDTSNTAAPAAGTQHKSVTDETSRTASGAKRGRVVRLADPPGASGTTN
jgi:HK97 family phage prohead protease